MKNSLGERGMIFMKYIYNIKDIMQILDIGRNSAYKLIQSGEIPYRRIGKNYKIPAAAFHSWLNDKKLLQNTATCDTIVVDVTN